MKWKTPESGEGTLYGPLSPTRPLRVGSSALLSLRVVTHTPLLFGVAYVPCGVGPGSSPELSSRTYLPDNVSGSSNDAVPPLSF